MHIEFKNIRNVRRLPEERLAYLCELDLKVGDEPWETVEYCARPAGGGICDRVIEAITQGNFKGEILDGSPGIKEFMEDLRMVRDEKLRASDIHVLPDRWAAMSEEKRAEWAAYRQALRDMPETCSDPQNPCWPEEPD